MYEDAKGFLDGGSYESAIKSYEKLEARFPYGVYAEQAELDVAYANFRLRDDASAIAACDRFIKTHPSHPNVDYAYYIKGLANYNDVPTIIEFLTGDDLPNRDPEASRQAFEAFKELVTRFPNSRYAPDATRRMASLVSALAEHELNVARYYMQRRAPLAAINRAQEVLKTFPKERAVEEALAIMIEGYGELNLPLLKTDAERVLKQSFPNSVYLSHPLVSKR